jgi:UDP-sugar transporter A1/2/3
MANTMNHGNNQLTKNGQFCSNFGFVFSVALLLPTLIQGKTPLSSIPNIPTHHGIDANAYYLKERGGAVVTKRRHWKNYPKHPPSVPNNSQPPQATQSPDASVTTSYVTKFVEDATSSYTPLTSNSVVAAAATSTSPTTAVLPQKHYEGLTPAAITYMSLLALQFGIQPILVRKFTPQTIVRSSVVLVQEVVKFGIAGAIYYSGTGKRTREKDFEGWSIKTWLGIAGLPAFLYTIQNLATLMAQQNMESLTFNVLNQTKILSAALSCYFIMGKRQSKMQVLSLCLLILSTLVVERIVNPASLFLFSGGGSAFGLGQALKGMSGAFASLRSNTDGAGRRVTHGVLPLLVASLISGWAGALTQLNTQGGPSRKMWGKSKSVVSASIPPPASRPPRNAYLFSMEMSIASIILLLFSLGCSSNGRTILQSRSFFENWTPHTFIPVITNSIGGILVGLVTKHAGSVRKGFALIFGLLLSGLFQANGAGLKIEQIIGGSLAATSLWMHTVHPYKAPPPSDKSD